MKEQFKFIEHDLVEDTEEYKMIADEFEREIIADIGPNFGKGYCQLYWFVEKEILKGLWNRLEISG